MSPPKHRAPSTPGISHIKSRLADRVFDLLRDQILSGRWGETLPSERHLSVELEVSRPTLHTSLCALEREGFIRGTPGQRWQVIKRPGKPVERSNRNPVVVYLRNANTKPDLTSLISVIDDLRQKLHSCGLRMVIENAFAQGTKQLNRTLMRIDEAHRPSFYILASTPPEVHRWYQAFEVPAAILGSRTDDVVLPAIDFSPESLMRHAVNHLFNRGHRRITLLQANVGGVGDMISVDTFRQTCAKHAKQGLRWTVGKPILTPPAVRNATLKYLSRPTRSSAFILTELELVMCMYSTIGELGLRIPDDVSILSTCYWPILDYLTPTPTSYESPWDRLSTRIVRIITNYQSLGDWPTASYNLLPKLRERESIANLTER